MGLIFHFGSNFSLWFNFLTLAKICSNFIFDQNFRTLTEILSHWQKFPRFRIFLIVLNFQLTLTPNFYLTSPKSSTAFHHFLSSVTQFPLSRPHFISHFISYVGIVPDKTQRSFFSLQSLLRLTKHAQNKNL